MNLRSKNSYQKLAKIFFQDCLWGTVCTVECFTGPFFLRKKIRGTRQTANYLYTFHSSPKHLPKVKSRGLDHSGKCFFMWFFMWFCKKKCWKIGFVWNNMLFWLIADICGTYQGILNFKYSRNINLEWLHLLWQVIQNHNFAKSREKPHKLPIFN